MKPETAHWLVRGERHLEGARVEMSAGLFEHAVSWCQQTLEALLKARLTEQSPTGHVPRTHILVGLARRRSLELTQPDELLLNRLTRQYSPTRYGDKLPEYTEDDVRFYLSGTERLFAWLRQELN